MRALLIILSATVFFSGVHGATFKSGQTLYTIKTKHFDIIYSKGSVKSAMRLAGMADGIFDKVTTLLSYTNSRRIPVVITPDIGYFNGYTSPLPYIHIVLYDSPPDGEEAFLSDTLKYVFMHELTHAVTMDLKSPFCEFFYGIFGAPFAFALAFEPEYMVEGSAVSFESLSGSGRANDPIVQELLREDIYENEFLSTLQASGSRDIYPNSYSYYYYGGLFNKYLEDRFGMEKYKQYWHSMANLGNMGTNITQSEYDYWFYSYFFEAAFGLPLKKLWADFKNSLTITNVSDNPDCLSRDYYSISSPVYSQGKIYFIDSFKYSVMAYSAAGKNYETVIDNSDGVDCLDISPDGRYMLVSLYTYQESFYGRRVLFYDLTQKKFLDKYIDGIYGARFFGKGIIALKADTHRNSLVYLEGDREETLFDGNDTSVLSAPVAMDDARIAFIMTDNGPRKLMVYNKKTGELFTMKLPEGAGGADYIRGLSSEGGRLLFCYNTAHEFYRLGVLEGNKLTLQTNNFGGGVFYPVSDGDAVYYTGKFSKGDKLMKYPDKITDIRGTNITASMEKFRAWTQSGADTGTDSNVLLSNNGFKQENYSPFNYLSPFQCWLVLPTSVSSPGGKYFTVDSIGVISEVSDPIDENIALFEIGYNYIEKFANLSGEWSNMSAFPAGFYLTAADDMAFNWQNYSYDRQTSASVNLDYSIALLPVNNNLYFGAGARLYAEADDPGTGVTPYDWPYNYSSVILSGYAGFSTLLYTDLLYGQRGMSFTGYIDYSLAYSLYKAEGALNFALPFIYSVINLYGAYCPEAALSASASDPYFGGDHYPAYMEFSSETFTSVYYFEGEFSKLIFNAELQNGWFPLYFNRLYMTAGYRAYLAQNYLQSVYTRLDLKLALPVGILNALQFDYYAEAAYNITTNEFYISGGVNLPF